MVGHRGSAKTGAFHHVLDEVPGVPGVVAHAGGEHVDDALRRLGETVDESGRHGSLEGAQPSTRAGAA